MVPERMITVIHPCRYIKKGLFKSFKWVDWPSLDSDNERDGQGSAETSDGKYGHSDGPEECGCVGADGLSISLDPCLVVKSFNVLQDRKNTPFKYIA